ncbi:MAG TPA: NAD(P)H-dependent glycerol-3-phosphate dehydrogenase [Thermoanaerobaculia bacterium]|nr:NAD(P)H-dependent glycerol-3-phosphate dehydrogenase [Thermoanaerobaculia bacterium]
MMHSVAVMGAGSFGTALAVHAARMDRQVVLWARRREVAEVLAAEGVNEPYLPGVALPPRLRPTWRLEEVAACEVVLVAVPSHGFREAVRGLLAVQGPDRVSTLVSATKGIEVESQARMSEVVFEEGVAADREVRFAVLSGPSFAVELARGMATAAVIASQEPGLAALLQEQLTGPSLRLYTSSDVAGVELGGASKNVVAIAAGVVAGLGMGHNTLAALITRGLHEMTRLGIAYGGQPRTFAGLAGLGDLVLTCTGGLSRNRSAGVALAEGKGLAEITGGRLAGGAGGGMVAEGIKNSLAVARLARRREVEMPITEQMVHILYEGKSARSALADLMGRELKAEAEL